MTIHKEGTATLSLSFIFFATVCAIVYYMFPFLWFPTVIFSIGIWGFLVSFFRKPNRKIVTSDNQQILSPCDGKVVVIEKVFEPEYLKCDCIQVSIFMSPLNVHINYFPTDAHIEYTKYHPGEFLVAWHPKSSTENERTTVCYNIDGKKVLLRQVAGALARRIVMYAIEGQNVRQGDEMGFIKFGSRVDMYLPLDSKINVNLEQVVTGMSSVIAHF